MKKRRVELFLITLVVIAAAAQIIFAAVYTYDAGNRRFGAEGLFITVLAFEFMFVLLYVILIVHKVITGTAASVLALKDEGVGTIPTSIFEPLNESILEVTEYFNALRKKESLKKELLVKCIGISDRAELLKEAMPLLIDITKANACCYYFVNNGTNKLEIMNSFGFGTKLYKELDISIGEGLEGVCCKTCKTHMTGVNDDGKYISTGAYISKDYKNVMAVPVCSGERCVGVITLAYMGSIHKENIADAEEIASFFGAASEKNIRFEYFARQKNETDLHYNIIRDITSEAKKKDEEIALLRSEIEEMKKAQHGN